jgi:hypothetical protein
MVSCAAPPDPRLRLILAHLGDSVSSLGFSPNAPPRYERARQGGIGEIDREGIIQYPARPRGRHGPPVGAAVLVQPGGDLRMPLAETFWRNGLPGI